MQAFSELLTSRFSDISLGSFLVRDYLCNGYRMPSAAVIMGTGTQPSLILSGIKKLVEIQTGRDGFRLALL